MTIKEIIDGLEFTVDMFLFDPTTGETFTEPRNDMDKTTIDACKGAIELLEQEPCEDIEEIREVMVCDADAETKCKMIFNILTAKPHYFKEQEPCNDCISRDMALEKMADYVASGYADSAEDFEEYSRIICQLPPVTPQPKMGRWIEHFDESGKWYECDQCHTDWGGSVNYCPNCGAKMGSEDKE